MALPDDLDEAEISRLQAALPQNLARTARRSGDINQQKQERSLLHRGVQTLVVRLFLLFQLLLPYVTLLVRLIAQAERRYRISESIMSQGLSLANTIGRQSVSLTGSIYGTSEGTFRQAISDAVLWTCEGIAGGLSDGLGEGLSIVNGKGL
jgi:hypothetical protein